MQTSSILPPYEILPGRPSSDDVDESVLFLGVMIHARDVLGIGPIAVAVLQGHLEDTEEAILWFHPYSQVIDGTRLVIGRATFVRRGSIRMLSGNVQETIAVGNGVITVVSVSEA